MKWVNLGRFGGSKKTKRSADEYFSFQIQECGSTTLETTLDAFCERSFNLLDATNAAILKWSMSMKPYFIIIEKRQ